MNSPSQNESKARAPERFLVLLAVGACLVITVRIWLVVSAQQAIWPIPGLYLIEMLLLSAMAAAAILRGHPVSASLSGIAFGGMSAFSMLAAWSIGLLYVPVAVLLLVAGLVFVRRAKRSLSVYMASAVAAAIVQVGIILAAIRFLYPGSVF